MTNRIILRRQIDLNLRKHEAAYGVLLGLTNKASRQCFIEQVIESIHRVEYVRILGKRGVSSSRANPADVKLFNPLLAAIYNIHQGNLDEAFWLIFLFTHFGKGRNDPWRYSRELYGKLGQGGRWDWQSVSSNPNGLMDWINDNIDQLSRPGGSFGNHRKYESWGMTGQIVSSYVEWVGKTRNHHNVIGNCIYSAGGDSKIAFHLLYQSMSAVYRFGRMGKFDYLTMLGKLGLADIEPGYVYVSEATGPRRGGLLLFGNQGLDSKGMERQFNNLAASLGVNLQVMEDSVCNWQKSPSEFVSYRI